MQNQNAEDVGASAEIGAILTLQLTRGLGVRRIAALLERHGSACAALEAGDRLFAGIQGVSESGARKLLAELGRTRREQLAEAELERCAQAGVRLIAKGCDGYPVLLQDLPDAPPLLWVKGNLDPQDRLRLAVVGSRRCSGYGRRQAESFSGRCAALGFTIVSGGAIGIDGVAHRVTLRAGGSTLAVIGSGLARPYPDAHQRLFEEIVASGQGCLISELPLETPPAAQHFPRRNRIISGLSLGVLVIEAGERSGALITARICVEDHGRELMAVPGPLDHGDSAGCHRMIREQWATLVTRPEDVMEQIASSRGNLRGEPRVTPAPRQPEPKRPVVEKPRVDPLSTLEGLPRAVAEALQEPRSLDQLIECVGCGPAEVQSAVTRLEIKGLITRSEGRLSLRH